MVTVLAYPCHYFVVSDACREEMKRRNSGVIVQEERYIYKSCYFYTIAKKTKVKIVMSWSTLL